MPTITRTTVAATIALVASTAFASGALAAVAAKKIFSDVPTDHWASEAIASMKEDGLMKGTDGKFRPNEPVTRAELAVVLDRLLDRVEGDAGYDDEEVPDYEPADADDDMVLGRASAPVTIIEFSDFQCPFCARFHTDTFPDIQENYIDTGKVKFVYRDYPLSFHPWALPAAVAVECAHAQSGAMAWELHDIVFNSQDEMSGNVKDSVILNWAADVEGLDLDKFIECYDAGEPEDEIDADVEDGNDAGISGTPGFWILGPDGQSKMVSGAQPFSVFDAILSEWTE